MSASALPPNPFPGLRPFREDEEALFFGREKQVDAMIDKLAATHFLAVVGTSGSGKSSLVTCGLVPALHRGLMAEAGSMWKVATLRPGNQPMRALAEALARPGVLGPQDADESGFTPAEMMEATLRMSKLGLVDAVAQAHLDPRQNLLVVVDQFEELFRYQALASAGLPAATTPAASTGEDATAFVNLLLEVCTHRELPVWVVMTMRSDFLGECAQFFGLPEAINRGQYLVPRMSRDERRSAIAGPLSVSGAEIDPVLLTRLVNDVGDNPDQLSILQHALNRTWVCWCDEGAGGALALRHYEASGTMAHALNKHAEEAFGKLGEGRPRALAEALFKAITDKVTDARGTRRPTRLDTLCTITGGTAADLVDVIEVFRDPERSFLMPPSGVKLRPETPIDISHESLMRVWDRLRVWGDEEAQSAQTYRRLAETAELNLAGRAGLLRQPDLQAAVDWRERQRPNAAWAGRYRVGFEKMLAFVERSEREYERETRAEAARLEQQARDEKEQRRTRALKRWALPVMLLLGGVIALMLYLYYDAVDAKLIAVDAKLSAEKARDLAVDSERKARQANAERDAQYKVYAQAALINPELGTAVAQAEQAIRDKSLVYLQFPDPAQKAIVERLRLQLEKAGYTAPDSEQVSTVPSRLELRYFRKADADEAVKLADLLRQWDWGAVRPVYVQGYENKIKLRQFEIWLPRPDAAASGRPLQ